jgi:autotransporter-associated beta strand protein
MDAGSTFTNSNGTAIWDGTVTLNGAANIGAGTATVTALTLNGAISGASGALTKTGEGLLTLAGTAANTYGGLTTVSAGFLYLNKPVGTNAVPGDLSISASGAGGVTLVAADQIPDTATVTLTTATSKFNINAKTETVANVDVQNANTATSEGLLTGANGKLTITGTLTHTLGSITLNSSGAGNSSFIDANTVINNGGDWTFGALTGTQKLIVGSGGLTIGGGSTIAVNALVGTADNFISLNGNVTSSAAAATNSIVGGLTGTGQVQLNGTRTITVADGAAANDLTVSTIIADGTGTGAIIKDGAGTLILNAVNTYTGTTTVNAGTLGGTGTVGAVIVGSSGTIAPGTSTGTLTAASADLNAGGTLAIEIDDASTPKTDTLAVAGNLDITGAKLNLSVTGAPTQTSYTIATAGSITGTFAPANITGLPSGYALSYTPTQINLVKSGFEAWIAGKFPGETNPSIIGKTADPDGDGMDNITEFALDGAPDSGAATGKVVGKIASVGGSPTLVISLPVRAGVVNFTGATEKVSDTVDGVTYKIQGSDELTTWNLMVSEVTGTDKTTIESSLPAVNTGWTRRTFKSPGTTTGDPAEFLRAAVIAAP